MPTGDSGLSAAAPELARRDEPTLVLENIQGNVVAGFKKPFQTLLYYSINDDDTAQFKGAIGALAVHVATARAVLDHNREVNGSRTFRVQRLRRRHG